MIYQRMTASDLIRAFDEMGRGDQFSSLALRNIFEWYESFSDDMGEDMELDVISICCDWAEHTAEELIEQYGHLVDLPDGTTPEDDEFPELIESLEDRGTLMIVEHVMDDPTYLFME